MKNNKTKYSSYNNGLEIGDIVHFNINSKHFFVDNRKYSALVLDREFLYQQETMYGLRKFFRYTFLGDLSELRGKAPVNDIFNIETKHIRVLKTIKGRLSKGEV